jgi:hypothetical protein
MGAACSVPPLAYPFELFQTWTRDQAARLLRRYERSGLAFSLGAAPLANLLRVETEVAHAIVAQLAKNRSEISALGLIVAVIAVSDPSPAIESPGVVLEDKLQLIFRAFNFAKQRSSKRRTKEGGGDGARDVPAPLQEATQLPMPVDNCTMMLFSLFETLSVFVTGRPLNTDAAAASAMMDNCEGHAEALCGGSDVVTCDSFVRFVRTRTGLGGGENGRGGGSLIAALSAFGVAVEPVDVRDTSDRITAENIQALATAFTELDKAVAHGILTKHEAAHASSRALAESVTQRGGCDIANRGTVSDAASADLAMATQRFRAVFALADRDGNGSISRIELIQALRAPENEHLRTMLELPLHIRQTDGSRERFEALYQVGLTDGGGIGITNTKYMHSLPMLITRRERHDVPSRNVSLRSRRSMSTSQSRSRLTSGAPSASRTWRQKACASSLSCLPRQQGVWRFHPPR